MKELVVISGKGGTGKTSITASFAMLARDAVVADCDVDAPDLHLILQPETIRREDFSGGKLARIDTDRCRACGTCAQVCRSHAIHHDGPGNRYSKSTFRVDPYACEGCGVCAWFCPEGAINFAPAVNGEVYISRSRRGPLVHARLGVGQGNSGKLVSAVRQTARHYAERNGFKRIITDGSPGIGCPVIASITGSDAVLIVTEPTMTAIHDMERVAGLVARFRIPAMVCINKWDLNPELSHSIERDAQRLGITLAGKVAYDDVITDAQIACKAVVEFQENGCAAQIRSLWHTLEHSLLGNGQA
ncbi:MAG: ATP-binding protein [Candidatus Hydrogenedentes bacterium]|nr:ATP-binding protein [Candidatus Hydrogenedentota bacterium]